MKKYMIVYSTPEDINQFTGEIIPSEQSAIFTDDREKAEQVRMDCECGLGGYAEVYRRTGRKGNQRYELWYC